MPFARNTALAAAALVAAFASAAPSFGQTASTNVVPFAKFQAGLSSAHARDFLHRAGAAVRDTATFEQMRHYLLSLYGAVSVKHSFALDAQVFDCVPVMQQPGVRLNGITALDSPPPTPSAAPAERAPALCAASEIPMRRITLDELTRFSTLQQFFHKSEGEADPHSGRATQQHKYAFAYQYKKGHGTATILNIWKPTIATHKTQVFALSQSWDVGGSGSKTQTAEAGWQVYPAKYDSAAPILFIYWTADDYGNTGCYNLDCAGFVQKDNSVVLGGPLRPSHKNGSQHMIALSYYLYKGDWWLMSGGTWIGYYPVTVYKHGALAKRTTLLEFGGETVGTTSWPPMGSGVLPGRGYRNAAFQRGVQWFDSSGTAHNAALLLDLEAPNCYKISTVPAPGAKSWNGSPYFYFGGPGGKHC